MEEPTPNEPRAGGDDFLARLTERVIGGENIDPEPLCAQHPEHAATIREICARGAELAAAIANAGEPSADTVKMANALRTGTFDEFLAVLRAKVGPSRYAMRGEIATGGMGAILRVQDQVLQRPLAMKVILGQGAPNVTGDTPPVDDRTLGRFLDEAQVTAQLDHPGIVPVHELGVDSQGRVYFTMKLVKGETFAEIIERVLGGDENWTVTRAVQTLLRVAEAMAYAHDKRVLHRDLKPSNIMVGRFGEVYVMDWGLARVMGEVDRRDLRLREGAPPSTGTKVTSPRRDVADDTPDAPLVTMDGDVVGTPAYMPPEQAAGRVEEVDARSDVYSFGAILYHLLAGHMPYVKPGDRVSPHTLLAMVKLGPPEPIDWLAKGAPPMLIAICRKAMARKASERYADMNELAGDLRAYLDGRVVQAYRTGALAEMVQWVKRNRATAWTIASSLAVAVSLVAYFIARLDAQNTNLQNTNSQLDFSRREALKAKNWAEYLSQIRAAADFSTIDHDSAQWDLFRAASTLDSCDPSLRGWEWRLISQRVIPCNYTTSFKTDLLDSALAWSSTGTHLFVGRGSHVHVLDAGSGIEIANSGHLRLARVDYICSSPDGKLIAIGGPGGIEVLDAKTLVPRWNKLQLPDQTNDDLEVMAICFSPSSMDLAVVYSTYYTTALLCLMSSRDGLLRSVAALSKPEGSNRGNAWSIQFNPTQDHVAISNNTGVQIVDLNRPWSRWKIVRPIESFHPDQSIRFDSKGTELFVASHWRLECYETSNYTLIERSSPFFVNSDQTEEQWWFEAGGKPDEKFAAELASRWASDSTVVYKNSSTSYICAAYSDGFAELGLFKLSPDNSRVASSCGEHVHVGLVEALKNPSIATCSGSPMQISLTSSGRILFVDARHQYDIFNPLRRFAFKECYYGELWRYSASTVDFKMCALSANGAKLALGSLSRIDILDTSNGSTCYSRQFTGGYIQALALGESGKYLAVAFDDRVEIIDISADSTARTIRVESTALLCINEQSRSLVTLDHGYGLHYWSLDSDDALSSAPVANAWQLASSPDGCRLAVRDNSGVNIFALPSLDLVFHVEARVDPIAWSEDSTTLLGYYDGLGDEPEGIRLWQAPADLTGYDEEHQAMIEKCWQIAENEFGLSDEPRAMLNAIERMAGLSDREKAGVREQWLSLMEGKTDQWYQEMLDLSTREPLSDEDRSLASHLLEKVEVLRGQLLGPINGEMLFRLGLVEESKRLFLDLHFETTWNYFKPEAEWDVDDEVSAWLALIEHRLGNDDSARKWLQLGKIDLAQWTKNKEMRSLIERARAACGLPINPEGLPPIPDDDADK